MAAAVTPSTILPAVDAALALGLGGSLAATRCASVSSTAPTCWRSSVPPTASTRCSCGGVSGSIVCSAARAGATTRVAPASSTVNKIEARTARRLNQAAGACEPHLREHRALGRTAVSTRRRPTMSAQHPSELEDVISAVAGSYGAGRLIDSLGTTTLPNKRQVIERSE